LAGLRDYRAVLNAEEHRVSYWRRIVHARIDIVAAVSSGANPTVAELTALFADARPISRRQALLAMQPVDDLPPLPDLMAAWSRQPILGDDEHNNRLLRDLDQAEKALSSYRAALHRRIATATTELIARYCEDPLLCLSALPLERPAARVHTG
jgi:hypothetical protein